MKKLILSVAVVAGCFVAGSARQLNADEALSRVYSGGFQKAISQTSAPLQVIAEGKSECGTAYYMFSNDRQTFIVSADDVAVPLLGILDEPVGSFSQLNPTAQWWLGEYARQIDYAVAHRSADAAVANGGRTMVYTGAVRKAGRRDIEPLVKTQWDQGAPYNNDCPKNYLGRATYTGCVATAMAQAMKYFNWPTKGVGRVTYTWNNGSKDQSLSLSLSAITFGWSNMLDKYPTSMYGTSAQRAAVSKLMQAAGYSVDMNYGTSASGAMSYKIAKALSDNFNYDKGISYESRLYYTADQWDEMIYNNLANVGPVIYNGQGSEGGHSFICDGYRTDGFFHFNWGWSGSSDGYFQLNALNPGSLGTGGGSGGFNYDQDAIIGMQKPVSGSVAKPAFMAIEGNLTVTASGRTLTLTGGGNNTGFFNMSGQGGLFNVGLELKNTTARYVTVQSGASLASHRGYSKLEATLASTIPNGTYTLTPVYQVNNGTTWNPMRYDVENSWGSVEITVSGNTITVKQPVSTSAENVFVDIASESLTLSAGKANTISATIENQNGDPRKITTTLWLCSADDEYYYNEVQGSTVSALEIAGGAKVSKNFTLNIPADFQNGTYYLVFLSGGDIMNYREIEVTVIDGAGVDDIIMDEENGPVQYFNLQGMPVSSDNLVPGVYIERSGSKTRKVVKH